MKTFLFTALLFCSQLLTAQDDPLEKQFEGYFSNYFSFQGEDEQGKIYFAIDNNRQRTEKKYEANNFLYFNTNGEWKKLNGHDKFESEETDMEKVPSSKDFKFQYTDGELSSIDSPTNDLKIELSEPLKKIGNYGGTGMLFDIYSTKASLQYGGRLVKGNLISEVLIDSVGLKTFKNMMKVVFGGFKFDGYYLNVKGLGDQYIHLVEAKANVGLFTENIYNLNTSSEIMDLELNKEGYKVTKWKRLGFKKLPLEVEITLPDAKLSLHTTHFHKYRNLLFFAFGMGAMEGELLYKEKSYPVYGLSEVFKF